MGPTTTTRPLKAKSSSYLYGTNSQNKQTFISFNKYSDYVAGRVSSRNYILNALAGTSWGQQKKTLLMTYKAMGLTIINYAAPVLSPNLRDTNYRSIEYAQNEALRIATRCQKMSSIDHLRTETTMLKVEKTQSYCLHNIWLDV